MPWLSHADEKQEIILRILNVLPDWFGIPEAIEQYGKDGYDLPCYVAERSGQMVGFVSIKETSEFALEMHVLGVLPAYHQQEVGRELVAACETYCKDHALPLLHVKTLAPQVGNADYLKTYAFYRALVLRQVRNQPRFARNFFVRQGAGRKRSRQLRVLTSDAAGRKKNRKDG